jgi:hypothetical protein
LERVIDAELVGAPEPEELTMEDLINEMESGVDDADISFCCCRVFCLQTLNFSELFVMQCASNFN